MPTSRCSGLLIYLNFSIFLLSNWYRGYSLPPTKINLVEKGFLHSALRLCNALLGCFLHLLCIIIGVLRSSSAGLCFILGDEEVVKQNTIPHSPDLNTNRRNGLNRQLLKLKPVPSSDGNGESMFSMKGVFGALKKTVKEMVRAKFHELTDSTRQSYKAPASEQQYAEPVSQSNVNLDPTREELSDVTKGVSRLWDLDINRLTPGRDYAIDVGDGTKVYGKEDQADASLFRNLNQSVLQRPTYARFYALLDNYNSNEHVAEQRSSQEQNEEIAFIEEISRTAPIKYVHKYLEAKNVIQGDEQQFKNALRSLWFDLYNRGGTRGSSSAFEHVFVGEVKRDRNSGETEVSGMHNWIQFYVEEAKGRLDYQGFIMPRRRGDPLPDSESQLLTVQFKWNGVLKAVSSTLIGVSPEFEMALYTLCFFCGAEDNHVTLGPYNVNVKVYPLGNNCIGSAFPIAEE